MTTNYEFTTLLLRWTAVLALAWILDALLRRRDARWRIILWRLVLVLATAAPVGVFIALPGYEIRLPPNLVTEVAGEFSLPVSEAENRALRENLTDHSDPGLSSALPSAATMSGSPGRPLLAQFLWLGWALGVAVGIIRLTLIQRQLARLVRTASPVAQPLDFLVQHILTEMRLRNAVRVSLSDAITSPFVCGVFRPNILVPRVLVGYLSEDELRALLAHELAHIRGNDLAWNFGWRVFSTVAWFHPLAWRAPTAHMVACEQEADRAASSYLGDAAGFSALLAKLTLRVMSLPAVETVLTVNGSAQIVRRLKYFGRRPSGTWTWLHSVAAGLASIVVISVANFRVLAANVPPTASPNVVGAASRTPGAGSTPTDSSDPSAPGANLIEAVSRLANNRGNFRSMVVTGTSLTFRLHRADSGSAIVPVVIEDTLSALREEPTLAGLGYSDFKLVSDSIGRSGTQLDFTATRMNSALEAKGQGAYAQNSARAMMTLNLNVDPSRLDDMAEHTATLAQATGMTVAHSQRRTLPVAGTVRGVGRMPILVALPSWNLSTTVTGTLGSIVSFMDKFEGRPISARLLSYSVAVTEPPPPVIGLPLTPEQRLLDLHEQFSRGAILPEEYAQLRLKLEELLLVTQFERGQISRLNVLDTGGGVLIRQTEPMRQPRARP